MNNLLKIQKVSKTFYGLFSLLLIVVPLYYVGFWLLINQFPQSLITVGSPPAPMMQAPLSLSLRLIGLVVSLLPLLALVYVLFNLRQLFAFYIKGNIFSFEHVRLFKKIAKGLVFWVILSIIYDSATSVLFTFSNPPGQRELTVGISSSEITTLIIAAAIFVIAWVMDEGRMIAEEQQLTV